MATSSLRAPAARDSAGVDAALLILRVVLGLLILLHGLSKLPPPPAFLVTALAQARAAERAGVRRLPRRDRRRRS